MAHVGEGTTHQNQLDELDAEIAAMEAAVAGGDQQPTLTPEEAAGMEQGQAEMFEEQSAGVEELEQVEEISQPDSQEQAVEAGFDQPPEEQPAEEPQPTGRRSWKTDYLELENRYVKLRQASDRDKYETKQQLAHFQQNLADLSEQNELLKQQLVEIQQQATPAQSAFSDEDVDVLGADTVANVQKAINQAVAAATDPLQTELLQMKKAERDRLRQMAEGNRDAAYRDFEENLERLVPDFRTINVDSEFVKWLKEVSPYSGAQRLKHLHQAEQAGDVERVAQFFVEFKQLKAQPSQLLEQSVTPTGQGGGGAAPDTRQSPENQGPKTYTWQEVNQFYDDDIAGKYKGREDERNKLDEIYDLAMKQGRVR